MRELWWDKVLATLPGLSGHYLRHHVHANHK
jgi:hypothetical protein